MADDVDIASQNEEAFRQYLITHYREQQLHLTSRCYNCDESTERHFCCKECQEDWEKRKYFDSQRRIE